MQPRQIDFAMPNTLRHAAAAPAALSAFLRGVERRAALLVELQCGDPVVADTVLAAAMRAFGQHAPDEPMARWPCRFWTLLAAAPPLRQASKQATWPAGLQALAGLDPLARKALLLRLVAGLPEEAAAEVMGSDLRTYQVALAAACPRDATGQPDAQAWRALGDRLQQQLRELSPARLVALARLRENALAGVRQPAAAPLASWSAATRGPAKLRRRWPWVALVVLVCALALAATWYWPPFDTSAGPAGSGLTQDVRIRVDPLPEQPPAARFDAASALRNHPDLALLNDPEETTLAPDADFLAWVAAGRQALPDEFVQSDDPEIAAAGPETADAD